MVSSSKRDVFVSFVWMVDIRLVCSSNCGGACFGELSMAGWVPPPNHDHARVVQCSFLACLLASSHQTNPSWSVGSHRSFPGVPTLANVPQLSRQVQCYAWRRHAQITGGQCRQGTYLSSPATLIMHMHTCTTLAIGSSISRVAQHQWQIATLC